MIKGIIKKGINYIINKDYREHVNFVIGKYDKLDDEEYLKQVYKLKMGKELDLNNPTTFTEKLQWLKLYDRNPIYTEMVDKYEAKNYVSKIIGSQYIIKTLGVWNRFEDIDFKLLPEKFVLKTTHDSGGIVICKDKSKFDYKAAKSKLSKSLKRNYYFLGGREWPYKNVVPRIIAEEYMEDQVTGDIRDYKFFCFNGEPKFMFIVSDRYLVDGNPKADFFDMKFNHLPFTLGHKNAEVPPKKPINFDEMKFLAEQLSKNIPHVRVDFYDINGRIYFGELTFFHWSGFVKFEPEDWDEKIGSMLILPKKVLKYEEN